MNVINKLLESFDELNDSMQGAAGSVHPVTRVDDEKGGYEVFIVAYRINEEDKDALASSLIRCEPEEKHPESDINFAG